MQFELITTSFKEINQFVFPWRNNDVKENNTIHVKFIEENNYQKI